MPNRPLGSFINDCLDLFNELLGTGPPGGVPSLRLLLHHLQRVVRWVELCPQALNRRDLHFDCAGNGPVVITLILREHELYSGAPPISHLEHCVTFRHDRRLLSLLEFVHIWPTSRWSATKKENRFSLNGNGIMSSFLGRQFYRSTLYIQWTDFPPRFRFFVDVLLYIYYIGVLLVCEGTVVNEDGCCAMILQNPQYAGNYIRDFGQLLNCFHPLFRPHTHIHTHTHTHTHTHIYIYIYIYILDLYI